MRYSCGASCHSGEVRKRPKDLKFYRNYAEAALRINRTFYSPISPLLEKSHRGLVRRFAKPLWGSSPPKVRILLSPLWGSSSTAEPMPSKHLMWVQLPSIPPKEIRKDVFYD